MPEGAHHDHHGHGGDHSGHNTPEVQPQSEHHGMDHGVDGGAMDHGMTMSMYFHTGMSETVLFKFWKTDETGVFIISLIIIFLMAFAYEALKFFRERLYAQAAQTARESVNSANISLLGTVRTRLLTQLHICQTVLHMIQFVLSYFLMLIFMTYNVWLGAAVVLGAAAGFFCFGWNKNVAVDISEHCQ